jgi:glucan phosphorylase
MVTAPKSLLDSLKKRVFKYKRYQLNAVFHAYRESLGDTKPFDMDEFKNQIVGVVGPSVSFHNAAAMPT